jgi:hypothetical protein
MAKKITMVLKPYLFAPEIKGKTLKSGSKRLNELIMDRIKDDATNIESIFDYISPNDDGKNFDLYSQNHRFDGKFIRIDMYPKFKWDKVKHPKMMVKDFSVDTLGPDTWMEGDIFIIDAEEAKGTRFKNGIELVFDIVRFEY